MAELPTGTVTFLFTDLAVSTRLWDVEPDAMRDALARHDEILRDAVETHDGVVVKGRGDGIHAAFATAEAAVRAAIACELAVEAEAWSVSEPLRVRIGLHTGVAELRDGDYFGSAVNRAARLEAIAHGGQIVCSQATADLALDVLAEGVEFVDLGEHRLRDLARPERVCQVSANGLQQQFGALASVDAFATNLPVQLTSFIGRDADVVAVAQALENSRLVTLTGVGGVGKTRLAIQVAAELSPAFAHGVWLCELAATSDPDLLAQVVVATMGVQPRAGRSLAESVCDYLSGKHVLIVLDNCEHLLDAAAEIAEAILLAAPRVRHHAEGADVVAALHRQDERRRAAPARLRIGPGKDVLFARHPPGLDAALLGQVAHASELIGPENEVDVRRPGEQRLLLLLRDASGDPDARAAARLEQPVPAERRVELVLRLLANRASVQKH